MFEEIYQEIKYPYKKKNISYKIFKYANSLLVYYFILTYIPYLFAFYFKQCGNISRANNILTASTIVPIIIGTLILISYSISIIFRKKI